MWRSISIRQYAILAGLELQHRCFPAERGRARIHICTAAPTVVKGGLKPVWRRVAAANDFRKHRPGGLQASVGNLNVPFKLRHG